MAFVWGGLFWGWSSAQAQPRFGGRSFRTGPEARFQLSDTVQLDEADSTVRTQLERVDAYLADGQWDEAVGTLLDVMEQSGGKLLGVTERRFVGVRDFCQLKLASLPPEALTLYRGRADPMARKQYEEGIAGNDRRRLLDVVEQAFASSWGDNALYALGEMALQSGDPAAARAYWEKVIPVDPPANSPRTWLCVPDTELDLAAVRARLVLASILEGSLDRAEEELAQLARLHPDAKGWFGGPDRKYVEALSSLLAESREWPAPEPNAAWPTFAGSPDRNAVAAEPIGPAEVAWRVPWRPTALATKRAGDYGLLPQRVAEDEESPLSYHPVVAGDLVLANNQVEILAVDLRTGGPAWGDRGPEVYRDPLEQGESGPYHPPNSLGLPRFTMTALGGKLYARMGSAVTARPQDPQLDRGVRGPGYLVCLDLEAEGRLVWTAAPPEPELSFEGSPVTDGARVYVAMRCSDIQPQVHVACLDAASGQVQWRQFVCAAETPAHGMLYENTHTLLTLHGDTIYVNTNLGAVAALSARDGRLKWVSLYPRITEGNFLEPAPHLCRDLNPCLYDRGILLVAPSDSRLIFALDAATGQILWKTGPEVQDVVHLLGVSGDRLIASGHRLYWISMKAEEAGRVKSVWPHGHEKLGYGRGVVSAKSVWWPTREKIYVFDRATGRQTKLISLTAHGATGGNLVIAGGYLLIAGDDELVAFDRSQAPAQGATPRIALRGESSKDRPKNDFRVFGVVGTRRVP